jgi:hypothetical protein
MEKTSTETDAIMVLKILDGKKYPRKLAATIIKSKTNKTPPIIVKSVFVLKAYKVKANTIAAVRIVAINIVWGSYLIVVALTR